MLEHAELIEALLRKESAGKQEPSTTSTSTASLKRPSRDRSISRTLSPAKRLSSSTKSSGSNSHADLSQASAAGPDHRRRSKALDVGCLRFPLDKSIYMCTVYFRDARPSAAATNRGSRERGNDSDSGKSRGCGPTDALPPDQEQPSREGVLHQPTPQSCVLWQEASLRNSFSRKHFKNLQSP